MNKFEYFFTANVIGEEEDYCSTPVQYTKFIYQQIQIPKIVVVVVKVQDMLRYRMVSAINIQNPMLIIHKLVKWFLDPWPCRFGAQP